MSCCYRLLRAAPCVDDAFGGQIGCFSAIQPFLRRVSVSFLTELWHHMEFWLDELRARLIHTPLA